MGCCQSKKKKLEPDSRLMKSFEGRSSRPSRRSHRSQNTDFSRTKTSGSFMNDLNRRGTADAMDTHTNLRRTTLGSTLTTNVGSRSKDVNTESRQELEKMAKDIDMMGHRHTKDWDFLDSQDESYSDYRSARSCSMDTDENFRKRSHNFWSKFISAKKARSNVIDF